MPVMNHKGGRRLKKYYKYFCVMLIISLLCFCLSGCTDGGTDKTEDIVILYTNDVHCGIEGEIGYSGLVAYKNSVLEKTPYVTLVDCGDAIQGEIIGTLSKGQYIIDIMNEVGYEFAVLGNHEFDYGIDQLSQLISSADMKYLGCNLNYTGKQKNKLSQVKPYEIKRYGDRKVAFIGVATPETPTTSTPSYFMEDGEFVYDFMGGEEGEPLYECVQQYIDECRNAGADYVVILSHLGDIEESDYVSSVDLIANTTGVDVVLDGHAHSVISSCVKENKQGEEVILSSTGTKLTNIGQLVITGNGYISTGLISNYEKKDEATSEMIAEIQESYEAQKNQVVASSDITLSTTTEDGIRLVRSRETAIGNLCADAYRIMLDADIGLVNGGGIRADITKGDITYADIIDVHPFGNMLCVVEATGQEIIDCLEIASRDTLAIYEEDGVAVGENGSFQSVSGLKYTIDTSVESSVIFDENGMFSSVDGKYRVRDVYVMNDTGEYEKIDPKATYTVASHNYLIKDSGEGITQFVDNKLLIDEGVLDYQVLIDYITEYLNGNLSEKYSDIEGRITIK